MSGLSFGYQRGAAAVLMNGVPPPFVSIPTVDVSLAQYGTVVGAATSWTMKAAPVTAHEPTINTSTSERTSMPILYAIGPARAGTYCRTSREPLPRDIGVWKGSIQARGIRPKLQANGYVFVASQKVTRVSTVNGAWAANTVLSIRDENDAAVQGAVVTAAYSGPTLGVVSGRTDARGIVTLGTEAVGQPRGSWCFTVTEVLVKNKAFNAFVGVPARCEGMPACAHAAPAACELEQNYPNPCAGMTSIGFTLSTDGRVHLAVYDLLGREVQTVLDMWMRAGTHTVNVDAGKLPAGTYYYKLDALGLRRTRVMRIQF